MDKRKRIYRWIREHAFLLCLLLVILEIALLTYANWEWGTNQLDSDDSAEMILSELLNRTGAILSRNWYYSTEIRVLNTQLVMAPLFSLFSDWHVVRTIGTAILLVILAGSYLFFCRSVNLGDILFYFAPLIVWPFSYVYYDIVLFGLYYIPHLSILFLSLGLSLNRNEKRKGLRLAVLFVLAFLAGMGGIRMIVVFYAPFFCSSILAEISLFRKKSMDHRSGLLLTSTVALLASGIGYLVNRTILSRQYSFYHWDVKLTVPHKYRIIEFAKSIFYVMGASIPRSVSLESVGRIASMIALGVLVILAARLILRWRFLSQETQILLGVFAASFFAMTFAAIFTTQFWSPRYLIMSCIGFIVVLAAYFKEYPLERLLSRIICFVIISMELISGSVLLVNYNKMNKHENIDPAYRYILSSDLEFGFGDWDDSYILTEISNGKIHMCNFYRYNPPGVWYWLLEKDFRKYGEGRPIFLLLDNNRLTFHGNIGHLAGDWDRADLKYLDAGTIVFHDDCYTIWQYPSLEDFEAIAGTHF